LIAPYSAPTLSGSITYSEKSAKMNRILLHCRPTR
jgi:hypothetical protein